MECTPLAGHDASRFLTHHRRGFSGEGPCAVTAVTASTSSTRVAQAYLEGESLHGLAKRYDVSRNLIRLWVKKYEAGEFDAEAEAAATLQEYDTSDALK